MVSHSAATACEHRPHDLLWVDDASALTAVEALPAWATPAWLQVAPVVVRRAPTTADRIPVGLRGATRSERCAAHVAAGRIIRKVTPYDIARRATTHPLIGASTLACLRMLKRIAPALDELGLTWGVTGSVGFTLASGFDVLRESSDLDLLVHAPHQGDAGDRLRAMEVICQDAEARIDVQVETSRGAFALKEWIRTGGSVLLKTSNGPIICDDPWQISELDVLPSALS